MHDVRDILAQSKVFKHLFSRIGSSVIVYARDMKEVQGLLKSIDFEDMWIEVETKERTFFFNLHKVTAIEGKPYTGY